MLVLDAATKTLEAVLAGAVTTNQLPVVVAYQDTPASFTLTRAYAPGGSDTQTNNTTAVTIVAAPGAGAQRQVRYISIYNADTVAATVTVRYNNNATLRTLVKTTLDVGDTLVYTDGEGWRVLTASGQVKSGFGLHDHSDASDTNALAPLSLDVTGGPTKFSGIISPAQITANQNNYNPTGLGTATVMFLTSDASRNITGLLGGVTGRIIYIFNNGSNPIVLIDESASSDATNRFGLAADLHLDSEEGVLLWYTAGGRWRPLSTSQGQGVWQPWTPVVEQPTASSVTVTVTSARRKIVGKTCKFEIILAVTGTGTINSDIVMSMPATPASSWNGQYAGSGMLNDSSAALQYPFFFQIQSNAFKLRSTANAMSTAGNLFLGSIQFTAALASGDDIRGSGSFEIA